MNDIGARHRPERTWTASKLASVASVDTGTAFNDQPVFATERAASATALAKHMITSAIRASQLLEGYSTSSLCTIHSTHLRWLKRTPRPHKLPVSVVALWTYRRQCVAEDARLDIPVRFYSTARCPLQSYLPQAPTWLRVLTSASLGGRCGRATWDTSRQL